MNDYFNGRIDWLGKKDRMLCKKVSKIHRETIGGINDIVWIKVVNDVTGSIDMGKSMISHNGLRYLEYRHFPIPKPTKA